MNPEKDGLKQCDLFLEPPEKLVRNFATKRFLRTQQGRSLIQSDC